MGQFISNFQTFLKTLSNDNRIPKRDLLINKIILILIISPIDFIPDWIDGWGLLDDFLLICLFSHYWIVVMDQEITLSHYPWSMKSYANIRKILNFFSNFCPNFISDQIWIFKKSPY